MVTNEATQCITATVDQCIVASGSMRRSVNTVMFTVYNLSLANYSYTSENIHDPDGDSNGTAMTVANPDGENYEDCVLHIPCLVRLSRRDVHIFTASYARFLLSQTSQLPLKMISERALELKLRPRQKYCPNARQWSC